MPNSDSQPLASQPDKVQGDDDPVGNLAKCLLCQLAIHHNACEVCCNYCPTIVHLACLVHDFKSSNASQKSTLLELLRDFLSFSNLQYRCCSCCSSNRLNKDGSSINNSVLVLEIPEKISQEFVAVKSAISNIQESIRVLAESIGVSPQSSTLNNVSANVNNQSQQLAINSNVNSSHSAIV